MDYIQLKTAIERFGEMLEAFRHNDRRPPLEQEAVQDSLIERFEYTLEVAWKTCKRPTRRMILPGPSRSMILRRILVFVSKTRTPSRCTT